MRKAARSDSNQAAIVAALRSLGCSVQCLHTMGGGVPDLLCAIAGGNFLVEVKDGKKPPSAQKLTPDQVEWHKNWRAPVYIVNSVATAVDLVQKLVNGETK